VFFVCVIALVTLAWYLPDVRRLWIPLGNFGFETNNDNIVVHVDKHSQAARRGIRIGDHLVVARTKPQYRMFAWVLWSAAGGQSVVFPFERGTNRRDVELVSQSDHPLGVFDSIFLVSGELAVLVWVGIGAALVLLRPSPVAWAFYVCSTFLGGGQSAVALGANYPWSLIAAVVGYLILASGPVGAAVFCLLFLHEPPTGWRRAAYGSTLIAWLLLLGLGGYNFLGNWFELPTATTQDVSEGLTIVLSLVAVYALGDTYFRAKGSDKQRVRWLVAAFTIAVIAFTVAALKNYVSVPRWFDYLFIVPVIVPPTVAYAVTKHRVIDVRFAINRAIVLTILTSFVVVVFALIDWAAGRLLDRRDLGVGAGLLAVTMLAFTAQALHRRVSSAVEKTLFRQRHLAEQRLARVARELLDVQAAQTFSAILVHEPAQAFGLTSAALFRRRELNRFEREDALGWPADSLRSLDFSVPPLSKLAELTETERIHWEDPAPAQFPSPDGRPVLAMPIVANHTLQAIVLYGPHDNGADLDRDEIRSIDGMMIPAIAAFHHLEAEGLRHDAEHTVATS
jgi:hypothetical protein